MLPDKIVQLMGGECVISGKLLEMSHGEVLKVLDV